MRMPPRLLWKLFGPWGPIPVPMTEIPRGSSNALNVESAAAFDFHIAPQLEAEAAAAEAPNRKRRKRTGGEVDSGVGGTFRRWISSSPNGAVISS